MMRDEKRSDDAKTSGPRKRTEFALRELGRQPSHPERSSDPYNSSGSFDRKKNWEKVGKR